MTFDDLMRLVLAILPHAQIEQDHEGQYVIYTNLGGTDDNITEMD